MCPRVALQFYSDAYVAVLWQNDNRVLLLSIIYIIANIYLGIVSGRGDRKVHYRWKSRL